MSVAFLVFFWWASKPFKHVPYFVLNMFLVGLRLRPNSAKLVPHQRHGNLLFGLPPLAGLALVWPCPPSDQNWWVERAATSHVAPRLFRGTLFEIPQQLNAQACGLRGQRRPDRNGNAALPALDPQLLCPNTSTPSSSEQACVIALPPLAR